MKHVYLEINVVRQQEKPGLRPFTRAEAEDFGHVFSAEGRIRHNNVMFRDVSVLDHLAQRPASQFQHAQETQKYSKTQKASGFSNGKHFSTVGPSMQKHIFCVNTRRRRRRTFPPTNATTPFSDQAVFIIHACGLDKISTLGSHAHYTFAFVLHQEAWFKLLSRLPTHLIKIFLSIVHPGKAERCQPYDGGPLAVVRIVDHQLLRSFAQSSGQL